MNTRHRGLSVSALALATAALLAGCTGAGGGNASATEGGLTVTLTSHGERPYLDGYTPSMWSADIPACLYTVEIVAAGDEPVDVDWVGFVDADGRDITQDPIRLQLEDGDPEVDIDLILGDYMGGDGAVGPGDVVSFPTAVRCDPEDSGIRYLVRQNNIDEPVFSLPVEP